MSNRLTAQEARKIAMDWRNNVCAKHVDALLGRIKAEAQHGRLCLLDFSNHDEVPNSLLKKAMEDLGYKVEISNSGKCFTFSW